MINARNDLAQQREPFAWSRLLPAILFLHLRELAVKNLQLLWQAAGVGNVPFLGSLSLSRESDDRLEAKIDRLLSEHGIDPAPFDYQEEEEAQG